MDDASQVYAIIDMVRERDSRVVSVVLVDTQIIIDLDLHDKLLVDALKALGRAGGSNHASLSERSVICVLVC